MPGGHRFEGLHEHLRAGDENGDRRDAERIAATTAPTLQRSVRGLRTFQTTESSALLAGMIARPGAAQEASTFRCRAFGSQLDADWQVEAYALVALMLSYLEPDPSVAWSDARMEAAFAGWDRLEQEIRLLRSQRQRRSDVEAG